MVLASTGLVSPLRRDCSWVNLHCENRCLERTEVAFLTFHFIAKVYISAIRAYIMCENTFIFGCTVLLKYLYTDNDLVLLQHAC